MQSTYNCCGKLLFTPKLRVVGLKKDYCTNFILTINRGTKRDAKIDKFRFFAFGVKAKYICDYAAKGSYLAVTATPEQHVYFSEKKKTYVDSVMFRVLTVDIINSYNSNKIPEIGIIAPDESLE